jgi:hypothetical protein
MPGSYKSKSNRRAGCAAAWLRARKKRSRIKRPRDFLAFFGDGSSWF